MLSGYCLSFSENWHSSIDPHRSTHHEGQLRSVEFGRAELECDDEPSSRLGNAHLNIESLKSD